MTTMMTTCSDKAERSLAYATVCGAHHRKKRERNQDALIVREGKFLTVLCVADGVGSQRYSRKGSRAVTRAVAGAFADFVKGKVERKKITASIFERYKNAIGRKYKSQASTTCMFVAITKEHGVFVGQIGDGLCAVRINGKAVYISRKDDEFANIVTALSPQSESPRWTTRHFNVENGDGIEAFLSTDGVSGDIIDGHEEECLEYFIKAIDGKTVRSANGALKKILVRWGESGSNDDKTVIVYRKRV